jgi:uncharacterized membrane protein (DUF2068 family)
MLDVHAPAARGRRPRAVSFVASLVLAEAAAALALGGLSLMGLLSLNLSGPTLSVGLDLAASTAGPSGFLAAGGLALGVLLGCAGVGLLRMHAWAWLLAVVAHGVVLADTLAGYALGRPQYELMAIASAVVLVLNQREVREAFLVAADAP